MKKNPLLNFAIALSTLILSTSSARAIGVTATWTNGAGTNAWENAGNWDTNPLFPNSAAFNAVISISAPCNLTNQYQIGSLNLSVNTANLNLVPGALLAFTSDVNNNGTILVNTTATNTTTKLRFDLSAQITGSGNIQLNGIGFNVADLDANGNTVTIGASQTVHGQGTVLSNGGIFINNGILNADVNGGGIGVEFANSPNSSQNNGTFKATNGSDLVLDVGTTDQTGGGTILADGNGSRVDLARQNGATFATIIGGTLNTANGGVIFGNNINLKSCTNNGTVQIPASSTISGLIDVMGSGLTNNGTITVNPNNDTSVTARLRFFESGTLGGSGSVLLNGTGFNVADLDANANTLTIGASQTVHGQGTLLANGGIFINNGILNCDVNGGGIGAEFAGGSSASQNSGTFKATNGGDLVLDAGTTDQTGGGTIRADGSGSRVDLGRQNGASFATIIGGTLTTANNGVIFGNLVNLNSCTNSGTMQIPASATISGLVDVFGSGLTNNGTITVNPNNDTSVTAKLRFFESGTLGGSGSVLLNGTGFNVADLDANANTLTIGSSQTVHGQGTLLANGGIFINNGVLNADVNGGGIGVEFANGPNSQNKGTFKATNGGDLVLDAGTTDQTGGGTILADGSGSIVDLGRQNGQSAATILGGTLTTANNGVIVGNSANLNSCTNSGNMQIPASAAISGLVDVLGSGLTNNGTITVNPNAQNFTAKLRFFADGTLGGNGSVILNGILGSFNVADLDCNGHAVINGANHTIKGNGNIFMNGGTLTNNGMIAPGLSPGHLDYSGTLTLGSTSNLVFEVGGTTQVTQYDLLSKSDNGTQTLGGNLVVRLINNFTPASTDMFTILTTQTTLAGAFTNVASGGRLSTADGRGSFVVTYSGNNVVLSQFVAVSPSSKIVRIFARENLAKTSNALPSNFTITGTDPKKVIVRGLGPSLLPPGGDGGNLTDPTLVLQNSSGVTIATNDNWKDTQQAEIQASGHAPTNDKESAIVITLLPGSYTATLHNRTSNGVGNGLVDVYDLNTPANSQLNKMSARGFTGAGSVLTGGFTIGGGSGSLKLLLRAIGPSKEGDTLQDPTLTLSNANGSTIYSNDNWQDTQKAQILATGLAPFNAKESAILITLAPGDYTEKVLSKTTNTGTAHVELYNLPQH